MKYGEKYMEYLGTGGGDQEGCSRATMETVMHDGRWQMPKKLGYAVSGSAQLGRPTGYLPKEFSLHLWLRPVMCNAGGKQTWHVCCYFDPIYTDKPIGP